MGSSTRHCSARTSMGGPSGINRRTTKITRTIPTMKVGIATGVKAKKFSSTPPASARDAMRRLELVPMIVIVPPRAAANAIGMRTRRAGMPLVCSSSWAAGIVMAMIGVLFISDDAKPTGNNKRESDCRRLDAPPRILRVARETIPVCTTPAATTSIAATVTTPVLDRPLSNSLLGATPSRPARVSVAAKASTGGTRPEARATRQPRMSRLAMSTGEASSRTGV